MRSNSPPQVIEIDLPQPKLGGKCFVLNGAGIYVLARGPGILRTIACTHAGSGSLQVHDGVPDAHGHFHDEDGEFIRESEDRPGAYNGRHLYRATPTVMGSWMLDGGFMFGLTVHIDAGGHGVSPVASIVWLPYVERQAKPAPQENGS